MASGLFRLVVAVAVLGGCSSGIRVAAEDPRVFVQAAPFAAGGDDARITGQLRYDEDARCFMLTDPRFERGEPVVAVWPSGSSAAEGEPRGVDVDGFGTIRVGDWLDARGGHRHPAEGDDVPDGFDSCTSESGYADVQEIYSVGDEPPAERPPAG